MQHKTKAVKLSDINIIDGETQQREIINEDIVAEYAEAMRCGATFPAVTLFFDGVQYWLADGFHRYHATKDVPALDILADVYDGTKRDARLFSAGANGAHGQRLTSADKRRSVLVLLLDKEWSAWSDNQIAKHCHVTHPFVGKLRSEINGTVKVKSQVVTVTTPPAQPNNHAGVVSELPKKEAVTEPQTAPADEVPTVPILEKPHATVACENSNIQSVPTVGTVKVKSQDSAQLDDDEAGHIDTLTMNGMLLGSIDSLSAEVAHLKSQLANYEAAQLGGDEYIDRLNALTAENKRLSAELRNMTIARDRWMAENVSLRKQGEYAARKLKALDRAAK